jgi:hypothetical protein
MKHRHTVCTIITASDSELQGHGTKETVSVT